MPITILLITLVDNELIFVWNSAGDIPTLPIVAELDHVIVNTIV